MRARFLLPTVLALPFLADASPAQTAQKTLSLRTWSRTYGGPAADQGLHDLRQLPDGRVVVAGHTGSFGKPLQSSWLMHLDPADGQVRRDVVSGSAFGGVTDGAAIASDGGALFLGRDVYDIYTKHDAWATRVDAQGAPLWSVGFTRPLFGRHFLFDAAELGDGSWVAVGATGLDDQPPQAAWVVRLSSAGQVLWQYEYGGGITETGRSVTPTLDGGFAVAGWSNSSGAGDDDVWVLKLDGAGAIQWQATYGSSDADQAEQIVELSDGGFALAGYSNGLTPSGHAPWVLRLDANGGLLWHAVVGDGVWGDLGGLAETPDGQLVVVGRVAQAGFPTNDLWAAKLVAASGKVLWQRAYEGLLGDFGSRLIPMLGPGLLLGGTWGWGFAEESIWLLRTDRLGRLPGCDLARRTTFTMLAPPVAVQPGVTVQVVGAPQQQKVVVEHGPSAATVIERCR